MFQHTTGSRANFCKTKSTSLQIFFFSPHPAKSIAFSRFFSPSSMRHPGPGRDATHHLLRSNHRWKLFGLRCKGTLFRQDGGTSRWFGTTRELFLRPSKRSSCGSSQSARQQRGPPSGTLPVLSAVEREAPADAHVSGSFSPITVWITRPPPPPPTHPLLDVNLRLHELMPVS